MARDFAKHKTVLLVEDNPDDVSLTLRAFERSADPLRIVPVTDGAEALRYLTDVGARARHGEADLPALVLLDLKLPKLDGIQVLREMRAREATRFIPVVVLTTSREQEDLISCYASGANSYIRKPVDYLKFAGVVQQLGDYWLDLNEVP